MLIYSVYSMKRIIFVIGVLLSFGNSVFAQTEVSVSDMIEKPLGVIEWQGNVWDYSEADFKVANATLKMKTQKIDRTMYMNRGKHKFMNYKGGLMAKFEEGKLNEYCIVTVPLKKSNAEKVVEEVKDQLSQQGINVYSNDGSSCATIAYLKEMLKKASKGDLLAKAMTSVKVECWMGTKGHNIYYLFTSKMMGVVNVALAVSKKDGGSNPNDGGGVEDSAGASAADFE